MAGTKTPRSKGRGGGGGRGGGRGGGGHPRRIPEPQGTRARDAEGRLSVLKDQLLQELARFGAVSPDDVQTVVVQDEGAARMLMQRVPLAMEPGVRYLISTPSDALWLRLRVEFGLDGGTHRCNPTVVLRMPEMSLTSQYYRLQGSMPGYVRQHMTMLQDGGGSLTADDLACVVCLESETFPRTRRAYRISAWACEHANVCATCIVDLVGRAQPCPTCRAKCKLSGPELKLRLELVMPHACSNVGMLTDEFVLSLTSIQFATALREIVAGNEMGMGEADDLLTAFFDAKWRAQSGAGAVTSVLENTNDAGYMAFVMQVLHSKVLVLADDGE